MVEELDSFLKEFFLDGKWLGWRKWLKLKETLRRVVAETDEQDGCRKLINEITQKHKTWRKRHPNQCILQHGHSILQLALFLSFEYSLQDTEVVSALLTEVYQCEKTFEKLFAGAVFGPSACYLITGSKSEFVSVEDNIAAVEYFLQHATKSRMLFDGCRLGEVILKNADSTPLEASLRVRNLKMAALLLKFGATVDFDPGSSPQKLLLLCKIRIRSIFHSKWELPFGLGRLPLPKSLVSYVETVDSELIQSLLPGRYSLKIK